MNMRTEFHLEQETGSREEQQDYIGWQDLPPHHKLFVLADGMGGHTGGREASRTVGDAVIEYLAEHLSSNSPDPLREALDYANRALGDRIAANPGLKGMGTTLIAVLLDERDGGYQYISVGDSPLYLYNISGLRRINANHAFAEDLKKMVAAGEISREEAQRHPARHAVTSAVMGIDISLIDRRDGSLNNGDTLLLASDGIQTLDDEAGGEIETLLHNAGAAPLAETGRVLLDAVLSKAQPRQDNTSLILVRIGGLPEAPATKVLADSRPTQVNLNPVPTAAPATAQPSPPPAKHRLFPILALGILIGAAMAAAAFWWWQQQKRQQLQQYLPHITLPKPAHK